MNTINESVVKNELFELAESKRMYDKWLSDIAKAESEPLVVKDGKVVSGTFWIGLVQGKAKARRKPASKASAVESWAMKYANRNYDYAA